MTTKYYIKIKCSELNRIPSWHTTQKYFYTCYVCNGKSFTRGTDVTELMKKLIYEYGDRILKDVDNLIEAVEE